MSKVSDCCGAEIKEPEMRYSGNYECSCGKTYRIEAQAAFLRCQKSHPKYVGICTKCLQPCTIASQPVMTQEEASDIQKKYGFTETSVSQQPDASPDRLLTDEEIQDIYNEWYYKEPLYGSELSKALMERAAKAEHAKTYPLAFEAGYQHAIKEITGRK